MIGYMGFRVVRSVYRADQRRAATPKPYALPPLWAALFVIPFVLLMAFLPSHGGVLAFLLFPLILGAILLGGFIAFQCKLADAKSKPKRYVRPPATCKAQARQQVRKAVAQGYALSETADRSFKI
jgi:GAF domain-containing protein